MSAHKVIHLSKEKHVEYLPHFLYDMRKIKRKNYMRFVINPFLYKPAIQEAN